jgi:hypothetical protein
MFQFTLIWILRAWLLTADIAPVFAGIVILIKDTGINEIVLS